MGRTNTKIDELIEESYLATLPEQEIRQDLLQFVDTCDRLIKDSREDRIGEELRERLAAYKVLALRIDQASELADEEEQWSGGTAHDLLAHRAARLKLLILEMIRSLDRELATAVEQQRYPAGERPHKPKSKPASSRRVARRPERRTHPETPGTVLRVAYAVLAGATLFTIVYRVIH